MASRRRSSCAPTPPPPPLDRIGHELSPLEIVVCATRAGQRWGQEDYIHAGCSFGRDARLHLAGQGIRVVGTDVWSWDAPFRITQRGFAASAVALLHD